MFLNDWDAANVHDFLNIFLQIQNMSLASTLQVFSVEVTLLHHHFCSFLWEKVEEK